MSDTTSDPSESTVESDEPFPGGEASRQVSLRVKDMTKRFDDDGEDVVAVENMNLEIYDGEFIVLVGPSGCGKTTTLRVIAGLEEPSEGSVLINGNDVAGQEPRERGTAMVFQSYALYPHKTVRQNIAFPLEIRKYPEDEVEKRVDETTRMLGISELLDRRPSDLSGGQQQRVALGRAIVRDPELFLFDEPLSNLDAKLRNQMRTELNKLHNRVGKTSVYVTHDQAEAMTLGDRIVVMNNGEIQQMDSPEVVYERPTNSFVAGFIGEPPMNFFDVRVETDGDGARAVSDTFDLRLPPHLVEAVEAFDGDLRKLELGIRPEAFEDAAVEDVSATEGTSFEARVMVVEPMGPHKDLAMRPVGAEDDEVAEFTARVSNDSEATEGDTIRLAVDIDEVHLFDATTGESLLA